MWNSSADVYSGRSYFYFPSRRHCGTGKVESEMHRLSSDYWVLLKQDAPEPFPAQGSFAYVTAPQIIRPLRPVLDVEAGNNGGIWNAAKTTM